MGLYNARVEKNIEYVGVGSVDSTPGSGGVTGQVT